MATDPVCYANVDEDEAIHTARHKGETYYFCTAFCRKKFEESPDRYVKLARDISIEPGMSC